MKSRAHSKEEADDAFTLRRVVMGAVFLVAVLVFLAWWFWERVPVVQRDNLRYLQMLRTAVSAENREWVEGVAKAIDARLAEGKATPDEMKGFQKVIDVARRGEWPQAEKLVIALESGQMNRRREFSPPEGPEPLRTMPTGT